MVVLPEEELDEYITEEHKTMIYECVKSAVEQYRNNYAKLRFKHTSRTDANIIHDLMVWNIKESFDGVPGARCLMNRGCFRLALSDGAVAIRFKKLNSAKKAQKNYPVFSFEQLTLFGPPTSNLNAGYQLDGLNVRVYITCPADGKRNHWVRELEVVPVESASVLPDRQLAQRMPTAKKEGDDVINASERKDQS